MAARCCDDVASTIPATTTTTTAATAATTTTATTSTGSSIFPCRNASGLEGESHHLSDHKLLDCSEVRAVVEALEQARVDEPLDTHAVQRVDPATRRPLARAAHDNAAAHRESARDTLTQVRGAREHCHPRQQHEHPDEHSRSIATDDDDDDDEYDDDDHQ